MFLKKTKAKFFTVFWPQLEEAPWQDARMGPSVKLSGDPQPLPEQTFLGGKRKILKCGRKI